MDHQGHGGPTTAVLEVSGVQWATEKAVVEAKLGRRPGVVVVDANPVAQTATVTFDPSMTSVAALRQWVRDCGYHCAASPSPPRCATRQPSRWQLMQPRCMSRSAPRKDTLTTGSITTWGRWCAICAAASFLLP